MIADAYTVTTYCLLLQLVIQPNSISLLVTAIVNYYQEWVGDEKELTKKNLLRRLKKIYRFYVINSYPGWIKLYSKSRGKKECTT